MALVSKTFSQIITFTRASTATYFDATGTLQSAAIDAPRFDYDPATLAARGFLIEEARTNLLTWSASFRTHTLNVTAVSGAFTDGETVTSTGGGTGTYVAAGSTGSSFAIFNGSGTFSGTLTGGTSGQTATISSTVPVWVLSLCSVTADVIVAPDGTTTADKLTPNSAVAGSYIIQESPVTSGTSYTFSFFAKAAGFSLIRTPDNATFLGNNVEFNLATGVSTLISGTATHGMTDVGNGWYRCFLTGTSSVTASTGKQIRSPDTGDGTSGFYIWGAQLEAGAFPTSYIPTTTTALTRSADVASVNTLSPWFNATEGTLYSEFSSFSGQTRSLVHLTDGTINNRVQFFSNAGNPYTIGSRITSSGVTSSPANTGSIALNTIGKAAITYAVGSAEISVNGGAPATASPAATPAGINVLGLGGAIVGGTATMSGHLRRVTYYPRALSSAELQTITA